MKLSTKQRLFWNACWRWLRGERDTLLRDVQAIWEDLSPEQRLAFIESIIRRIYGPAAKWPLIEPEHAVWTDVRDQLTRLSDTALRAARAKAIELIGGTP